MSFPHLLAAGTLGGLTLGNRILYAAMDLRAARGGVLSPEAERCLLERARRGPALVSLPGLLVRPRDDYGRSPALAEDALTPSLAALTDALHRTGAKVSFPLYERGTRHENGQEPIGPSPVRFAFESAPCRPLDTAEIHAYSRLFGRAARRARQAGADAVELHACTGKLLNMFVSPYSNRRSDAYGGSTRKRARFLLETLEEIRGQVGADFPLILRLGVDDLIPGGLTLEQGLETARLAQDRVDAFVPVVGTQERIWNITPCFLAAPGYTRAALRAARAALARPLIAMGKLGDPVLAEELLARGEADFVSLGRPLLADPAWVEKVRDGAEGDIRRCIGCLNCLTFARRPDIPAGASCTVNPAVLREEAFARSTAPPRPGGRPRRVLVAGGGLAGMTAADLVARRGHDVTLCEAAPRLGGQWLAASAGPEKGDYRLFLSWLENRVRASGAAVRLQTPVTPELARELAPDLILVATGARPRVLSGPLPVPGPLVIQGSDLLRGEAAPRGNRAVVVGGRYIGLEAAQGLAGQGMRVDVVDAAELGVGANPRVIGPYRDRLVELGARFFPHTPLLRVTAEGVDVAHLNSLLSLPADTVVLAMGTVPETGLLQALEQSGVPCLPIGDCKRIGDALYAVRDGADAALTL